MPNVNMTLAETSCVANPAWESWKRAADQPGGGAAIATFKNASRIRRCAMAAAMLLTVAGCATTTPEQRSQFDSKRAGLKQEEQSILASGCVIRDEVGSDVILRNASVAAAEAAARGAKTYLGAWGVPVKVARTPMLCAGFTGPSGDLTVIGDTEDSPRAPFTVPIPTSSQVPTAAPIVLAYQELYRRAGAALLQRAQKSGGYTSLSNTESLSIEPAQLELLRKDLGNSVWLVSQNGLAVSAGKSIGVGILSALVGAAASGGSGVIPYSMPIGSAGTTVVLVRLDNPTLVWAASSPFGAPDVNNTTSIMNWGKAVFAPLFDPDHAPVASSVATIDPPVPKSALAAARTPPRPVVRSASTALASTTAAAATAPIFAAGSILTMAAPLELLPRAAAGSAAGTVLPAESQARVVQGSANSTGNWYYLSADLGSGWVSESALSSAAANSPAAAASPQLAAAAPVTAVPAVAAANRPAPVTAANPPTAPLPGAVTAPIFTAGTTLTVTTPAVLLPRAVANSGSTAVLPAGTQSRVLRATANASGNWYYIATDLGSGWISESALAVATAR